VTDSDNFIAFCVEMMPVRRAAGHARGVLVSYKVWMPSDPKGIRGLAGLSGHVPSTKGHKKPPVAPREDGAGPGLGEGLGRGPGARGSQEPGDGGGRIGHVRTWALPGSGEPSHSHETL